MTKQNTTHALVLGGMVTFVAVMTIILNTVIK